VSPIALVWVLLAAAPAEEFVSHLWPGEGKPRLVARVTSLSLRREPRADAPLARQLQVAPGTLLEFDQTRYRTTRAGKVVARREGTLRVRKFGRLEVLSEQAYRSAAATETIEFTKGSAFEYLQYRAEGACLLRLEGEVLEAESCPAFDDRFELVAEPVVEWWVRLVSAGEPKGWLLVERGKIDSLHRQF
jgi:hypothetical protein